MEGGGEMNILEAWEGLHMLAKDREWFRERLPEHQADEIRHSMLEACKALWRADKRIKWLERELIRIAGPEAVKEVL